MSASREKKSRQELSGAGQSDPKTAREAQQRREERRSNILYGVIAVVFVLVAVTSIIWKSNIIQKTATAATIDGEKYTAAEVTFHYQNVYRNFLNDYYGYISYGMLGLNPNSSLAGQTITESDAAMLGLTPEEVGQTWEDYFIDQALSQMAAVQSVLKTAREESFVYPDSVQADLDASMASLQSSASASNLSVDQYLRANLGGAMTEKVYRKALERSLQYEAYAQTKEDALTYSDAELEETYNADRNAYDRVSYEAITVSGVPAATTDADGNTVEATDEEKAAAMEAAKTTAEEILATYRAGASLESFANPDKNITYSNPESAAYASSPLLEWAFDDARREGDAQVVEGTSSYYVAVFHSKSRNEYNTVDVRHVLIQPEATTLTSEDEGYQADVDAKKAAARARAEELYNQYLSGTVSEETFAELARENSADGNAAQGGLYEQVYKNQMVETFNDWCFDDSRNPGDTGLVETDYGYHILYFVGENEPYWKVQVTNDLKNDAMNTWYEGLTEGHTIEKNASGMKYVG